MLGSLAIWTTLVAVTSPARTPALTRLDLVLNAAIVTVSTLLLSLVTLRETRRLVRASYRERDRARAAAATYEKTRRDLNSLVTARTAHLQSVLTETEELIEELSRTAMRDHLTGLYNRRYLDEELPRQIAVAERRRRPLSVVLLDLVNFKQVNDDFSHATGDQVLTQTAGVLAEQLQPEEVIARFGGDEFIVLLPDSLPSDAAARVEEFRRALAATDFEVAPGRRIDVRAGISIWSPKGGTGADATRTTAQHSEAASDLLAAAAADLGRGAGCSRGVPMTDADRADRDISMADQIADPGADPDAELAGGLDRALEHERTGRLLRVLGPAMAITLTAAALLVAHMPLGAPTARRWPQWRRRQPPARSWPGGVIRTPLRCCSWSPASSARHFVRWPPAISAPTAPTSGLPGWWG